MYMYLFLFLIIFILVVYYLYYYIKKVNCLPETLFPLKKKNLEFPVYKYGYHIPKVFHRTHLNQDLINNFNDVEQKIMTENSNFQIINYTEEDVIEFIKEYYNDRILKAYNSIKSNFGAAKADFFRYLVIYAKGGVYIDIKSGPVKNIDRLLKEAKNNILVSYEKESMNSFWYFNFPKGEMLQWAVMAPKGHPVVRELIEQCLSNIENDYSDKKNYIGGRSVIFMTGPMMFTNVIKNSKHEKIKYLKPNMDGYFSKYLTNYDKEKLSNLGTVDYHHQTDNVITEHLN
jgi:inositol phosphorylceramide mannosyltransferase catalytic subunit